MNASPGPRLVLIVEDELMIAMALQAILEDNGAQVLGPAADVDEAMALLENARPDLALIDYRLGSGTTEPLLPELRSRDVPVCVLTGYSRTQLPTAYAHCTLVEKPFRAATLLGTLEQIGLRTHG